MEVYHVPAMKKKQYTLRKMKVLLEERFAVPTMVVIGTKLQVRNLRRLIC